MRDATSIMSLLLNGLPWAALGAGALMAALYRPYTRARKQAREAARLTERKLAQEESRFRAITKAMPDLVMVLDEDGRYLDLCTLDESRLVAPPSQMLGRTVYECLPLESALFIHENVRKALLSSSVIAVEYPLAVQAGSLFLEARVVAMDDVIDGKRCVVWVSRDITERRKQEEQLRQTQKLESLGVMAGGIAHDFNNLLMAMQGNLNLAQMQLPEGSSSTKYIGRTESAIRKASDLAKQMLAYAGRSDAHIQNLDLNRIVEEMTGLLKVTVSKKVELNIHLEPGLPAMQGDLAQIQQVVMNLVTNASEAIGDEEGRISIGTSHRELSRAFLDTNMPTQSLQPGPYLSLCVSDTGCGMGPELLSRIFDPFFSTKSAGRGLGLSIMISILRGHNAGILLHTRPGRGTTFSLFFPAQAVPAEAPKASDSGKFTLMTSHRVLVVDDEREVRGAICEMLEAIGMEPLEACDGIQALEVLEAHGHSIDVVLLDLTMPRMNGVDTFKALRSSFPEMPVLFSSGFSGEAIASLLNTEPAVGFILKPYPIKLLQRSLVEVMDSVAQGQGV